MHAPSQRSVARMKLLPALSLSLVVLAPWPAIAQSAPAAAPSAAAATAATTNLLNALRAATPRVLDANGKALSSDDVKLTHEWTGNLCRSSIKNVSAKPQVIKEVVLFDFQHGLAPDTEILAEGFQKLAMLGGTLATPQDLGSYPDRTHYKIPEPEGLRTAYGMFTARPAGGDRLLLASTSCNRFISRFSFDKSRLRVSFDCENLTLEPGQAWQLEEFIAISGPDREKLYDQLGSAVQKNHKRLEHDIPAGWCSWICFGPEVTAKNVSDVTQWIAQNEPRLKYIQIDDGYQPWMGDWLETGKAFGGGVRNVLKEIKDKGLEPAIWVAPFIASPQSELFKQHPDWFVKDADGKPLPSDKIGFGGWRQGPWYALDGTHPEAQKHLTHVFKTMREEWGVTYFKLDANYWGAMHGGVHYDKKATRIDAYRRGMEAVLKGSGDAFILGCNHPLWPSFGLIHGSRASMDIAPNWKSFRTIAKENMYRAWQNGRFWWNDPDTILLNDIKLSDAVANTQLGPDGKPIISNLKISEDEFRFHATSIYASGGMILSGDDLTKITPEHAKILKKMLPPTGVAARFENENFEVGEIQLKDETVYAVFNPGDQAAKRVVKLKGKVALTEKLTDADLGTHSGEYVIEAMPPHSGMLIIAKPAK